MFCELYKNIITYLFGLFELECEFSDIIHKNSYIGGREEKSPVQKVEQSFKYCENIK
jgi:hypothetical protein